MIMVMLFKGLTIKEKMQIAESVVPFDMSFNRRCPGIFASPCPCIGFDKTNYRECKFNSTETICGFSVLYRELEDIGKNRKYLTYNQRKQNVYRTNQVVIVRLIIMMQILIHSANHISRVMDICAMQ
jgi:hypothetical protein